jgi:aspartyl-tRNA(Asn)/glutamyl-tRNA(Gln) amidotransferase subunit A
MLALESLSAAAARLAANTTSSEALTEEMLARAEDPSGEGARAFLHIDRAGALAQARATDLLRQAGVDLGPLMGLPISVKDLFDIKGQVTRAGSTVLAGQPAASADADIVARLRRAGAVLVGRTNMVEFAYSGIGLNPHYGTPKNPWDRTVGRIPGGSSSGAPVSVVDGMALASIGTDTGGSVRIPAALCGITGYKPTANRISTRGATPLSTTLDSIGPLGASVDCCAILDTVMANQPLPVRKQPEPRGLRFLVPTNRVLDGLDDSVAASFANALSTLSTAGATIVEADLAALEDLYGSINPFGSFSPPEAFAWHRQLLSKQRAGYDPRVASRIEKGALLSAADYIELKLRRDHFCSAMKSALEGFDALLMPTVPIVAPEIAPLLTRDDLYWATNSLLLRNTSLVNFLDGCAWSLPIHPFGTAPVGLAVAQTAGQDARLIALGRTVEHVIGQARR